MTHGKGKEEKNQVSILKFEEKKMRNERFKKMIKGLVSENYYWLIEDCGTFLLFLTDMKQTKQKLYRGNFCKHRFCPMCAWRKARKDALELSLMMQDIQIEHDKAFIFLTLTAPNVVAEQLENEIKNYNASFKKLFERNIVKSVVKGYVRKLEITYNVEQNDYHPHFHVLIVVNKSYFNNNYLSQQRWLELWREVTGIPEITQVDVRRVKEQNNKQLYEMAKYTGKDSDYLMNQDVFKTYYEALKGKRLLVYGGLFKEARKRLKQGELDYLREVDPAKYIYQIFYSWKKYSYIQKEIRLMDEKMQEEVNNQMINELEKGS